MAEGSDGVGGDAAGEARGRGVAGRPQKSPNTRKGR